MTVLHAAAVSWFGARDLAGLARSFTGQTCPDWRLTVIDNSGSEAEATALAAVAATDRRIDVVPAPGNLGYLGAVEWWRAGRVPEARWLAVCNTDLELADDEFVARLAAMGSDPGVLAPDITAQPGGAAQNPYMLARPGAGRMLLRRVVLSHRLSARLALRRARTRSPRLRTESGNRDIYAPHGSFVLLSREFFTRGGTLEHAPFLFGEETTLAERARELGVRIGYRPELRVVHHEHASTGGWSEELFRARREAAVHAHRLITGRTTTSADRRRRG